MVRGGVLNLAKALVMTDSQDRMPLRNYGLAALDHAGRLTSSLRHRRKLILVTPVDFTSSSSRFYEEGLPLAEHNKATQVHRYRSQVAYAPGP